MSKVNDKIECTDIDDSSEFVQVHDGEFVPKGKQVMSLSFGDNGNPIENKQADTAKNIDSHISGKTNTCTANSIIQDHDTTFTQKLRGLTPKRDDEAFEIKRCYQFRPSTLKKLNILKVNSNDLNIYLNEIIDDAICYYYDAIFGNE